jgi:hypothetical protein
VGFVAFYALWKEALSAPVPYTELPMTTSGTRGVVSLAVTLTLALGACASASRSGFDAQEQMAGSPLTIRFENEGREHVHVYLVTERREWLLGRVEPGLVGTLRVPEASLAENPRSVRLAVLAGAAVTVQAARDPRATLTIAQPTSALLSQHWMFAQGQLTSMMRPDMRVGAGRP